MKNNSKSSSTQKPVYPIEMDKSKDDTMFGGNVHKIDPADTTAFSYHTIETIANNTSKDIVIPFSANSVQCQAFILNRVCSGSMGTSSQ